MHEAVAEWCARFAPNVRPVIALDIGGRDINGSTEYLFHPDSIWEVCDLHPGPRVTWVGNFLDYQTTEQFEVAICSEVGEHTPEWPEIIAHASSMLETDGLFLFTAAGPGRHPHSHHDGGALREGEYYGNIDPADLAEVMDWHFSRHIVDHAGADVRAAGWK
jgi:hypothetical protein